jgi:hypothetical protein
MNRADAIKYLLWAVEELHKENDEKARKYIRWANDEVL